MIHVTLDVCGLLGFPSGELRPAVISRIGFKPEITMKTLIRAEISTPEQAREEMIKYYAAHPKSPTATRRPQLSFRNQLWIAFLGSSGTDGIVGIGSTVEEGHQIDHGSLRASPTLTGFLEIVGDCFPSPSFRTLFASLLVI